MTLRTFKPNLQKVGVLVAGKKVTMKLCANCLKLFKKKGQLYTSAKKALG